MTSSIVRLLRLAAFVICLIVIASFVTFAVQQTKSASGHQQEQISAGAGIATTSPQGAAKDSTSREGAVHKALDEASGQLTSPFAGVMSGSSSEWATRSVELLLALLVYGFGLGYLARVLRVRV